MSNVYAVKDTEKYVNFHKIYNQRWKNDAHNKSCNYKTDNDIFDIKQNSQVIQDKNYYKQLAKELAEKTIDQKLRNVSPYVGGFKNQNFIPTSFVSHNLNQDKDRKIPYPSNSVIPKPKEKHTMRDILIATNYEERKEDKRNLRVLRKEEKKKEEELPKEVSYYLPAKLRPITPYKEKLTITPQQTVENTGFEEDSLILNSNHCKKATDVTTKLNARNQMKSLIFYDESAKKINHRRTASEGMSRKLYQHDPHYIGNDSEKKRLQELNESQKFYFYGEKRDALVETAKQKSEKKEKYIESLIDGYNYTSDFKKNVSDYLNRIDDTEEIKRQLDLIVQEREKKLKESKEYKQVLKNQMENKKEKEFIENDKDKEYIQKAVQAENEFVEKEEIEKRVISSHKKQNFKKENDQLLKIRNKLNNIQKKKVEVELEKEKKLKEIYENEMKELKEKNQKFKLFMRNVLNKQIEEKKKGKEN